MKTVLLVSLLVGCSSWKQKDFVKDLDKPTGEAAPQVKVDEKLLEKFEVKDVAAAKPSDEERKGPPAKKTNHKTKPIKPKLVPRDNKVEKTEVKVDPPKAVVTIPEEMVDANSKGKKVWDLYKPNHRVNEKVYLDIHYLGMTVGKIMFTNKGKVMINGKEVWHFHARFKSAPFYSNIYELDDTVDTYVTTADFLSIKYSLIQRESKQDVDDLQLYDRDQFKTFWFYNQKKSDGSVKNKQDEKPMPFFAIDPFSVVFLYQGLPLKDGDLYEIPLVNKGKILIFKSLVEGREKIETEKGSRNAIRVHATTKYTGESLKSGDMYLWFSDDDKKILLKAQAKIKIGSVTADIVNQ